MLAAAQVVGFSLLARLVLALLRARRVSALRLRGEVARQMGFKILFAIMLRVRGPAPHKASRVGVSTRWEDRRAAVHCLSQAQATEQSVARRLAETPAQADRRRQPEPLAREEMP